MTVENDQIGSAAKTAPPPTHRLALRMLLVVSFGLLTFVVTELGVRYWIELPELYRIEQEADADGVARVRKAIARRADEMGRNLLDYAAWTAVYDVMNLEPGSPGSVEFLRVEMGPPTYVNNQINGIVILDNERRIVHSGNIDLATGAPSSSLELNFNSLDERVFGMPRQNKEDILIAAGIAPSNIGHILFASARIVDADETLPARGTMLFWKRMDQDELDAVSGLTGQKFALLPLADARSNPELAPIVGRLQEHPAAFTPRDKAGMLYWQLEDFVDRPAFLVHQTANPRNFNPNLLSPSATVGFISSGLVLLLVTVYFSRSVVDRVIRASAIMRQIRETGAFHYRIPIADGKLDELDDMFQHFNALLERVARQDEDLREQNRRLSAMSQQDTLTGIPNRRALNENFDRYWRQAVRAKRSISVLMIDVDYFKPFNDRHGHQSGDRVLKQVAQTLQENLHRATDFIARYGGEEFCVILTETTLEHAVRVAEGLRKAVMDLGIRHEQSPGAGVVTISVGVSSTTPDQTVVHLDLVRAADRALYHAKELGRNQVFHFQNDVAEPSRVRTAPKDSA